MIEFLILTFAVIIASGIFSGIEAALFSVSQARALVLKEQGIAGADALVTLKTNLQQAIIVIVIGNNIVNIAGSLFVGVVAVRLFGDPLIGLISALLTLLIIIFGEILPKTIGENNAEKISLAISRPLTGLIFILKPLVMLLEQLTKRFSTVRKMVSEEELSLLSELGHLEGSIEEDERDIIQRVFTLNDITAYDIMTPRTMMVGIHKDTVLGHAREEIFEMSNSRLPVYGEDYDDIVGMCYMRDLLIALARDEHQKTVSDYRKDVLYVSEDMRVDDLLRLFLSRRGHMAIVKDEFEGTSGLVTLEDVLEQLVGEIVDETDEVVDTREEAKREAEESDLIIEESEDREEEEISSIK
ncbi:MAG: hemolysin family protein [Candidatus Pacebacteria bacterium]|nr:hemolysin family protein [Candidatus Paceibacterota bacterium]MCD8508381.1 hemolysin family protein [Candidatus Paceibacterota bacterium]MCD8527765.1 hemolysin family protein [Candidatus Paceibacterota bacterium]